jgi:predicted ATPase
MRFERFIGAFASREHPLVLFIDDLQWADAASLEMLALSAISPDLKYVLLIGAYRDNEVGPTHPLRQAIENMRQAGRAPRVMELRPLSSAHLRELVTGALHCSAVEAEPLTKLVHQKTEGNPFFAIQFLTRLYQDGLIKFDRETLGWKWDVQQISARGYTDNVVDLVVVKLDRLPPATRDVMTLAASIGDVVDGQTLARVHHPLLRPALFEWHRDPGRRGAHWSRSR